MCSLFIQEKIKSRTSSRPKANKKDSFFFPISLYDIYFKLTPFLFATISFLPILPCLLLIVLFIPPLSPSFGEKSAEVFDTSSFSPLGFFHDSVRERPSWPLIPRVFCKAMCSITVAVCPNDTINEQQIHSYKISVISTSLGLLFFSFVNAIHVNCPENQPS